MDSCGEVVELKYHLMVKHYEEHRKPSPIGSFLFLHVFRDKSVSLGIEKRPLT